MELDCNGEECPLCLTSRGVRSAVKRVAVSFDEAVFMCADPQCDYISESVSAPDTPVTDTGESALESRPISVVSASSSSLGQTERNTVAESVDVGSTCSVDDVDEWLTELVSCSPLTPPITITATATATATDSGVDTADTSEASSVHGDVSCGLTLSSLRAGAPLRSYSAPSSACRTGGGARVSAGNGTSAGTHSSTTGARPARQSTRRIRFGKYKFTVEPPQATTTTTTAASRRAAAAAAARYHRGSFEHLIAVFEQQFGGAGALARNSVRMRRFSNAHPSETAPILSRRSDSQHQTTDLGGKNCRFTRAPRKRVAPESDNTTSAPVASQSVCPVPEEPVVQSHAPSIARILDCDSVFVRSRDVDRVKAWARARSKIKVPMNPVSRAQ